MQRLHQTGLAHGRRPYRSWGRLVMILPLCAWLGACGVAPGMSMQQPVSIPLESGTTPDHRAALPIPVTNIDLSLIRRMHEIERNGRGVAPDIVASPEAYTIGRGDVLQITVWDHPELALAQGASPQAMARTADAPPGFVVDQDGTLQFPFAGRFPVAGSTVEQVQAQLARRLDKTFNDPQVTVRIASFRAKQVYIEGEVHAPGSQALNDIPMTIYDAIGRAGGFSSTADQSRIVLVRDGIERRVDLVEMAEQGRNPSKIVLRDGDLVRVLSRDDSGVFVMGEVNKPVTALPMRNGRLTLSDAIAQAGSLNANTADAAQLYVVRGMQGEQPQVFHLDAHSPVAMVLANQFQLKPKDIVYVDGNALVRFSRVLSLLLPAINAGLTTAIATK
ncbi:polysaccharide biosynthesis/export family protein [Burkholderia gladioli pv. gladioli]|uniref:Polysaccharide biosynthesis/export family protein n=1 Tax=Burkholderia gladioli TaxID=28095 RepID=A0AAW3F6G6_BURGA|nr:polysaccharide biosynthesis/export family protein [Burkholderia gladioli]AJW95644.1 polysaccharide biosynthesis/export family protein [Burkholderia gladioli]ASD82766.1 sugar ABC transporter substrate-binding protein [Burkholderia gladioli pv. gladioli]AWY50202.1 sugar ABC transporter substrate-binding protein [Burkholderia gladioli pv. gladioli]KGC15350.1 polysaccharide biosynthesis/export family protein [Burkholderia gladioli]MDJ1164519.1 polysaccharide biosynthesis/export family protein [